MSLPSSGAISMSQIRDELGQTGSISLGDISLRRLSGRLTGSVPMEEFRGKYHMERYVGPSRQGGVQLGYGLTLEYRHWFTSRAIGTRREYTLHIERWVDSRNSWLPDNTEVKVSINTAQSTPQEGLLVVPNVSQVMYWRLTRPSIGGAVQIDEFHIYTADYEVDWEIQ